jgi:uncharacterized protein YbcI
MKPQLRELIEEILHVSVVEILSDATLETGRSGIIVILSETPDLRDSVSNSKMRKKAS